MARITTDNCKAPTWDEFPKLAKLRSDAVFQEALQTTAMIAELTKKLKVLGVKAAAKIEAAGIPDEVKSIRYEELLITRKASYTRRSLDTKWAVKKLIAKGVKKSEIEDHTKETDVEGGISFQRLGAGEGEEE